MSERFNDRDGVHPVEMLKGFFLSFVVPGLIRKFEKLDNKRARKEGLQTWELEKVPSWIELFWEAINTPGNQLKSEREHWTESIKDLQKEESPARSAA